MDTVRFWQLDDEDRPTIDRLAPSLGRKSARVLAYLVLRADHEEEPATGLEIRIGTGLNRKAVSDAVARLEERDLLAATTVSEDSRGRPPKAWTPAGDLDAVARRAHDRHAAALLRRADAIHRDGDATEEAGVSDRRPATEQTLTLGLNWKPNGLHLPFYAAKSGGFHDRRLDVRLEHHEGSGRVVEGVVRGDIDVGLAGAGTVVRAREADESVCPIAVVYQRAMTVFYTVRDLFGEKLERVDQFRDRRVGTPERSETGLFGRLFLSQMDVDESVQFVETGGEERQALLAGEADIVTGSFADPRELARRDFTVDSIRIADRFPMYGPTLVVRPETLSERRPALRRFLAGIVRGWVECQRRPESASEALAAECDSSPARVEWTFERAVEEFGESEAVREHGWGWQLDETWGRLRTALEQGNLLAESP